MRSGVVVAGSLSAVLLAVILGYGLRSLRIVVAVVITLLVSLAWTTAYAMATVGEFNTISAAFAVLLLGLGVDFGIHFGLRYEEEVYRGLPVSDALTGAAAGTGGAISLCALTSAIGFASFIPTRFTGLAELGAIAAGGMLFSLIASYTVSPAVLALRGPPSHYDRGAGGPSSRWQNLIEQRAALIVTTACCIAIAATILAYRFTAFDFSTLAMKDPDGEGMTTLRELQAHDMVTDYALTMLAPDRAAAEGLAGKLAALDEVAETRTPSYFVPANQEAKLSMLEDAEFMLDSALVPGDTVTPPSDEERLASIESLLAAMEALPENATGPELRESIRRLGAVLNRVLTAPDPNARARDFERLIVEELPERMEWLRRALSVETITFDDLPASLRERVVDIHGRHSVVALPTGDMSDARQVRAFVDAVASVRPHATGRPSLEAGIGEVIVQSFRLAIALAFIAILIILRLSLHDFVEALIVLMPITLAALITISVGILFDLPFTIANVVAIPLVLGLGVDSAIHVYVRYRDDGTVEQMMTSSTPRAVLLSALTTLAAFCSLSLSPHAGFSGLGILLSISVIALLYCTLIVLPAMINVRSGWQAKRSAAR
jgi:hopanoid biosynthesis associated RND transporter like protein HpnN